MALGLRQIAINPASSAQRQQALELWKETRMPPQLARVEDLLGALRKRVETIVASNSNDLDKLLKFACRMDILPHRDRKVPVKPFYF
jgi:hypothetical protein